jgi:SAM-dependent methyltransferase
MCPGRIAVELASRGMQVTGVDLVQGFLDTAADTAKNEGVKINLVKADLRTFKAETSFDAAINLYTSFGYCETRDEDEKILRSIANSLKKGGWFILELLGREIAVRDFTEGEWFERAGKIVLTEFSVVGAWEGLQSKWILIDVTGTRTEHVHVQRLYSSTELQDILLRCGFSSVEVYGDFDFSPYNEKARTTVVVARK